MRALRNSAGARTALLAVSVLLVLGAFALPSFAAAADRNEFIHTVQWFESPTAECATGSFDATGIFATSGWSRSCARQFRSPSIVQGTTQLHDGDDLTVYWKMQCKFDGNDRSRHFDCKGQWQVNGPNWTGHGNTRAVLDFSAGAYGEVDFTFDGNLNPTS